MERQKLLSSQLSRHPLLVPSPTGRPLSLFNAATDRVTVFAEPPGQGPLIHHRVTQLKRLTARWIEAQLEQAHGNGAAILAFIIYTRRRLRDALQLQAPSLRTRPPSLRGNPCRVQESETPKNLVRERRAPQSRSELDKPDVFARAGRSHQCPLRGRGMQQWPSQATISIVIDSTSARGRSSATGQMPTRAPATAVEAQTL